MKNATLFDDLRANLKPKGTADIIPLRCNIYANGQFARDCISTLERRAIQIRALTLMGEKVELNALEQLAVEVLMESAGLTPRT